MTDWIKKHPLSTAIFSVLIFTLLVLIWGLFYYGELFIQDFTSSWLAAFLGIVVGIPVAIWISDYQKKQTEREKIHKILYLLVEELKSNKGCLEGIKAQSRKKILSFGHIGLRDELWRTVNQNGEFSGLSDPSYLGYFSDAYASINIVKDISEKIFRQGTYDIENTAMMDNLFFILNQMVDGSLDFVNTALKIFSKQKG